MANITAVVFDADGTLIDTREFIFRAYEHSIAKHKYPVPERAAIASQIGKKIEDAYAELLPGVDPTAMITDHVAFQSGNLSLIFPFDGAVNVVAEIRASGLKVVLWTSRRAHVLTALEQSGFTRDSFDTVVDATMVDAGKPDPEGLFLGLGIVGTQPGDAVMIGDAVMDIVAGKRAGVAATIGITHGFGTREQLVNANADYVVDSLKDLRPIIDVLAQAGADIEGER